MAKKRGKAKHKATRKTAKKSSHSKKKKAKHRPKRRKKVHKPVPKPIKIEEKIMRVPHELEEEFFVPSPVHRGKYRIPVGIKFLIGYLMFLSLLYIISFISGVTFPTTILFGKMIVGARALVINSVLLAIVFLMIYGFWNRKAYTFDLAVGFFSFAALNALISLMLFNASEHPVFRKLLLLSFFSLIIMNIVIIWYVLHERKYFYAAEFKDRPMHHRDKIFLYLIITFWTLTLLIGLTLGMKFYNDTTEIIDRTITEIGGNYYYGQIICEQKSGTDKDVCNLVLATALSKHQRPEAELMGYCDQIESEFYHFTCLRSIKE